MINPIISDIGTKRWYKWECGVPIALHRVDGPAVILYDQSTSWWLDDRYYTTLNLKDWPIQLYLNYLRWNRLEIR